MALGWAFLLHQPENDPTLNGFSVHDCSTQEPLFAARVVYDLLFFFVVIIIVLNLIFGVIIDTFADLRSEKQRKEEILKTTCFICGVWLFDLPGGGPDPGLEGRNPARGSVLEPLFHQWNTSGFQPLRTEFGHPNLKTLNSTLRWSCANSHWCPCRAGKGQIRQQDSDFWGAYQIRTQHVALPLFLGSGEGEGSNWVHRTWELRGPDDCGQ